MEFITSERTPWEFIPRPGWIERAACRGKGTDPFFEDSATAGGGLYRTARELCALCAVREDCLAHALAFPELYGMWGGTSERERVKLRRDLRRAVA
jgi:WhiB family transcriptional regulator, redox-sensing transcriptional regulator